MHGAGPRDRAELAVDASASLPFAACAVLRRRHCARVLHDGEGDRHLALQRVGDADHRDFGDARMRLTASSISRVPSRWPATLITSSVRPRMK